MDAVLALAAHPTLSGGPRMRATADSLRRTRDAAEAYRLAGTIISMAEYRLGTLGATTPEADVVAVPRVPLVGTADTALANAIARAERDTLDVARRAHESAREAAVAAQRALEAERTAVPVVSPGLAMLVIVLLGLLLRVAVALARELQVPTVAHPLEAERVVGAPALSLVRDALPEGPLRFRPSGVDPFRVLYLHLTSTGTRARAVIVTGDDVNIVAAVAARLAIAAAADHRTTLVAEWDAEQVALPRIFRDHPEPGVSDVMAGAFAWREVARSVGSSDGLSIAMLPAGTTQGAVTPERRAQALEEFQRFRAGFEFSIVAVSLADLAHGRALVPDAPIVLAATIGVTPLQTLERNAAVAETNAAPLHSLVLWDAPRPILPSRAELAAWLSKRKGRTPGGSFKAVQEAIKKPEQRQ
jgi:Mrp family chromosome partitioning ATPase